LELFFMLFLFDECLVCWAKLKVAFLHIILAFPCRKFHLLWGVPDESRTGWRHFTVMNEVVIHTLLKESSYGCNDINFHWK
jgi:hypothetical protein